MTEAWVPGTASCPQCAAPAEPEEDGDLRYYECTACGAVFGYRRAAPAGPVCAAGLPAPAAPAGGSPVFLGATITRRPE